MSRIYLMEDPQNQDSLKLIFYGLCSLSIIGELFIIISYVSIRKKTSTLYNQVIWLFLSDIIYILLYFYSLIDTNLDDKGCKFSGLISESTYVSSMFWTSIIAGTIYFSIKTQKKIKSPKITYAVLGQLLVLLFPLYPYLRDAYGIYDEFPFPVCWIHQDNFITILIAFWIPIILSWSFNVYCYLNIIRYLRNSHSQSTSKGFRVLLIFPLVQVVANSGGFAAFIIIKMTGGNKSNAMHLVQIITRGSEGLLNALAYGSSYSIRKDIAKAWCHKRSKRRENANLNDLSSSSLFSSLSDSLNTSANTGAL